MLFSSDTLARRASLNAGPASLHSVASGPGRFFVTGDAQPDTPARRNELLTELLLAAGHAPEEAARGEICYHESGQPYAAVRSETDAGVNRYPLSISHCRDFLAMALSARPEQRIGLDVEQPERKPHSALRKRISCAEAASDAAHSERQIPTLRLWTLKEAFLKMGGSGLRVPMRDVEIRPESGPGFHHIERYTAQSPAHRARLYGLQKDGTLIAVALELG